MSIRITAAIQGHPWDLWGLSKLFDGSDAERTRVVAQRPKGRPTFDTNDADAVARFRATGYDVFAELTSDELRWDEAQGRVDLRDLRPTADRILEAINGAALLLDPRYRSAKLYALNSNADGHQGTLLNGDWTPNRDETPLGGDPLHAIFAKEILPAASRDPLIKFVLDVLSLPPGWSSLYVIYDAIASDVGGVHKLRRLGWVSEELLTDFSNTANNSRSVAEGVRHGKKPQPLLKIMPVWQAQATIRTLIFHWFGWRLGQTDETFRT